MLILNKKGGHVPQVTCTSTNRSKGGTSLSLVSVKREHRDGRDWFPEFLLRSVSVSPDSYPLNNIRSGSLPCIVKVGVGSLVLICV